MGDVKRTDRRGELGRLVAAASRKDILEAAHRLFLDRGYVRTTIPTIAAEAGVAVQTIYNTVGGKRAVLGAVVELAVRGQNYPATVEETLGVRIRSESDPRRIVEMLADWLVATHARTAAISAVIQAAATLDPEVAELESTLAEARLAGYRQAADVLASRGGLPGTTDPESAAATIWSSRAPRHLPVPPTRPGLGPRPVPTLVDGVARGDAHAFVTTLASPNASLYDSKTSPAARRPPSSHSENPASARSPSSTHHGRANYYHRTRNLASRRGRFDSSWVTAGTRGRTGQPLSQAPSPMLALLGRGPSPPVEDEWPSQVLEGNAPRMHQTREWPHE